LNEFAKANPTKFIGNPINCFLILKQLTADIDDLVLKVGKKKSEDFKSKFKNFNLIHLIVLKLKQVYFIEYLQKKLLKNYEMPHYDPDLIGSIIGIIKLEDTYLIDTIDFAYGNASKNYPSFKMKGFFYKNFLF